MPEEPMDSNHFTSDDRKVLIETALLVKMTTADVQALKTDLPRGLETVRKEATEADNQTRKDAERHVSEQRAESTKWFDQMEKRVRTLENFRWWLLGAVAFVSPFLSALTTWLVGKVTH